MIRLTHSPKKWIALDPFDRYLLISCIHTEYEAASNNWNLCGIEDC